MSINRVVISGNLTKDPTYTTTPNGGAVLSFCVAVNEQRKDQQTGTWKSYPNFVDCVLFGKRATSLATILTKGFKVSVEGKLHFSKWQDKTGQTRTKLEVFVDEVEFMTARTQANPQAQVAQQYQPATNEPLPFN